MWVLCQSKNGDFWRFLTSLKSTRKNILPNGDLCIHVIVCFGCYSLLDDGIQRWLPVRWPSITDEWIISHFGPWAVLLLKGKVSLGMVLRPPSTLPSGSASGGVIPRKDRRCRHRRTFSWHWLSGNHQCCTLAIHSQHHIYNIQCNSSTLR